MVRGLKTYEAESPRDPAQRKAYWQRIKKIVGEETQGIITYLLALGKEDLGARRW